MDFLTNLTSSIPTQIAGIDTLYIALGAIVVIMLLWIVVKSKKSTKTKTLEDIDPEKVEAEEDTVEEKIEEDSEEDGFMPENISYEDKDVKPEQEDKKEAVEEKIEDEEVEKISDSSRMSVKRKKRESTRNGRKISKADFSDFSGRRLLIAEDNLINQKVLNGVLNESGIDIVMADDGQFVMEILEKDKDFEIILMDAHMPRMDGFEATRAICGNDEYNHIVVVALSGDTASDDIRHMHEAGMEEHLEKPLKMDALYDVMSMYYTMEDNDTVVEEESTEIEEVKVEEEIVVDVSELASLDYDIGLEICGNDEKMYKQLLKEFFVGYKNSSKILHAVLVKKDYEEAQHLLVDVKGTASNLGAKQFIYTVDKFLEAIASDDKESYSKLFSDYQKHILTLLKSIQNAFKV